MLDHAGEERMRVARLPLSEVVVERRSGEWRQERQRHDPRDHGGLLPEPPQRRGN